MPTLNISLTPELADLVNEKVTSGMYHSASEVIREGLRLLKDHDDLRLMRLEQLRKEIALGTEHLNNGETARYASGKDLSNRIKAEGRKRSASRKNAEL